VAPEDSSRVAQPQEVALFASIPGKWGNYFHTSYQPRCPKGCKQRGLPVTNASGVRGNHPSMSLISFHRYIAARTFTIIHQRNNKQLLKADRSLATHGMLMLLT